MVSFVQKESPLKELWIVQVCSGDLDEGGSLQKKGKNTQHFCFNNLVDICGFTDYVKNRRADLKSCSVEHQGSKRKQKRSGGNGEDLQSGCSGSRRGRWPCQRGRKRKIPRAILGEGECGGSAFIRNTQDL